MLRTVDRAFAALLILGAIGHTLGSIKAFINTPHELLWALCASVLIAMLGVLNLLRSWRPRDAALAWIVCAGTACWLVASIAFGLIIGKPFDPRVIVFVILSVGLIVFGLNTALNGNPIHAKA